MVCSAAHFLVERMADSLTHLSAYDFDLPAQLIAQHPIVPRDAARLLHVGAVLDDHLVSDLPRLLRPGDLLVANDTKVRPVQLQGQRGSVSIAVTLHKELGNGRWRAFAKPGRRLRIGDRVEFGPDLSATVDDKTDEGDVVLRFDLYAENFDSALQTYGRMPLPPYIKRSEKDVQDFADYQTLFAAKPGAVAAPTAGLHFTPALRHSLEQHGISIATITLHVGAGTFLPVKVDDIQQHRMHAEYGEIDAATAGLINETRANGGRLIAVGTTCTRLLESAAVDGQVRPFSGETDIFISPGFSFQAVDILLTNFHLPKSTLFMLVCAFAGFERMHQAYAHAIKQKYRFFSYGDACLLERST